MSKREKIIVGLMLVTIVWGAYQLLVSPGKGIVKFASRSTTGDLNSFAKDVAKGIRNLAGKRNVDAVLDRALLQWQKDPFLVTRLDVNAEPEDREQLDMLEYEGMKYTGYLEMGSRRMAIINGLEYAPGDQLGPMGATIRRIEPRRVEITSDRSKKSVLLPLQEDAPGQAATDEEPLPEVQ